MAWPLPILSRGPITLPEGQAVAPGQVHTFRFAITAPAQAGTYQPPWQMSHLGQVFGVRLNRVILVGE